ncbi:hypothetical protein F4774DRAFT_378305 [Daldinia eschscholtzii]|nr:hypothetical protein F4774DRAFT_378305 [Daldinia eschscholtzii]
MCRTLIVALLSIGCVVALDVRFVRIERHQNSLRPKIRDARHIYKLRGHVYRIEALDSISRYLHFSIQHSTFRVFIVQRSIAANYAGRASAHIFYYLPNICKLPGVVDNYACFSQCLAISCVA